MLLRGKIGSLGLGSPFSRLFLVAFGGDAMRQGLRGLVMEQRERRRKKEKKNRRQKKSFFFAFPSSRFSDGRIGGGHFGSQLDAGSHRKPAEKRRLFAFSSRCRHGIVSAACGRLAGENGHCETAFGARGRPERENAGGKNRDGYFQGEKDCPRRRDAAGFALQGAHWNAMRRVRKER